MRISPTLWRGLSEESGFWNTSWMSRRTSCGRCRAAGARSCPSNRIVPAQGGCSPAIARGSVDFPLPDSPTTPTVSPRAMARETSAGLSEVAGFCGTWARWRPHSAQGLRRCGQQVKILDSDAPAGDDTAVGGSSHPGQREGGLPAAGLTDEPDHRCWLKAHLGDDRRHRSVGATVGDRDRVDLEGSAGHGTSWPCPASRTTWRV